MFITELTLEQRVEKAFTQLISYRGKDDSRKAPRYAAMSGIFMYGNTEIKNIPTAATDGVNTYLGREFCDAQNDAQLRWVIVHEKKHIMHRHMYIYDYLWAIDKKLANIAMDYQIDGEMRLENPDGFLQEPIHLLTGEPFAYDDPKYDGWSMVEIFNDLRADKQKKEEDQQKDEEGNAQPGGGGDEGAEGDGTPESAAGEEGGFDAHQWEDAKAMDEEEVRKITHQIDQAIRQGVAMAGKQGTGGERVVGDLLEVQVSWEEQWRDFITERCAGRDFSTWGRLNRKYMAAGYTMPSTVSETMGHLCIFIDLSSSMSDHELMMALTEVAYICENVRPEGITLGYWDTELCNIEKYGDMAGATAPVSELMNSTRPKGSGGTCVRCVPKYLRDEKVEPAAVLVLTDGGIYNGWGEWEGYEDKLMWAIVGNKGVTAPMGKTVHIPKGV